MNNLISGISRRILSPKIYSLALTKERDNLTKCTVCSSENKDFSFRCSSCGSILQQQTRTLDLFSTIYNLWRFPDFAFRRIVIAEHRNYTFLLALFEAIGISFLFLFVTKAGDFVSINLGQLVSMGLELAVAVFLPFVYAFSILSYFLARVSTTGARLRGFTAGLIYALHPVAISAMVILPAEIAVFGPYIFSNNPSPQIINAVPFYLLGFLEFLLLIAALIFVVRLTMLLFRSRKRAAIFVGIFFILLFVTTEITKRVLVK